MDGMLAVEGGLKSPAGDLYNEFPDRISDAVLLMAFGYGYANASDPWSAVLGGAAACGALMTACIRMHGASLTGTHDFRGPMAKPQRMAVLTIACLLLAGGNNSQVAWIRDVMTAGSNFTGYVLGLITAGCAITCWRRLRALSRTLHARASQ
jgi:phosphatidylglycerophosphate synthase